MLVRSHFMTLLNCLLVAVGVALLSVVYVFSLVSTVPLLEALIVFLGMGALLLVASRVVTRFMLPLPQGHVKRLSMSLALLTGAAHLVVITDSLIGLSIGWILLGLSALSALSSAQRVVVEYGVIQRLRRNYEREQLLDLPVPVAYVHAEPGLGVYLAHRMVGKLMTALWDQQYLSPNAGLTVYKGGKSKYLFRHRYRAMILFLVSDSLRRYEAEFRQWLVSQSCAVIDLRTGLEDKDFPDEAFKLERGLAYRVCPGPMFTVLVGKTVDEAGLPQRFAAYDQVIECAWGLDNRSLESAVAPIANRLASNSLPLAASDFRLDLAARQFVQEIPGQILTPLADCYLRFRLAQSHVERFLSLLDGIEAFIKCSVIALFADSWQRREQGPGYQILTRRPLTLGDWVSLLRSLVHKNTPTAYQLAKELLAFWYEAPTVRQINLFDECERRGLKAIKGELRSQLDWVEWVGYLRNVTRGHGILDETSIAPVWHLLHQAYIDILAQGACLSRCSILTEATPGLGRIEISGWSRGRQLPALTSHIGTAALHTVGSEIVPLYPLMLVRAGEPLLWDGLLKQERVVDYINYASSERERFKLRDESSRLDLLTVWEKGTGLVST